MLLGFSFESRPKSRVLATAGSVMTIGLSKNSLKKKVLQEKTRLISPDVWAVVTSKV